MWINSTPLRHWLLAVLAPAAVMVAILMSRPLLDKDPFTSLLAAVIFVAWDGGEALAMIATALSMLFTMFFYLAPHGTLRVKDPADIAALGIFLVVALFTGRTTARLRDAIRREQAARIGAEGRRVEAEELREFAESSNRAKDEFLAMLGHELRNPLEAIAAATGVLKRMGRTEQQATLAQEVITRQVAHLRALTGQLLDVARLTTGKIVLVRQPVDLADIAKSGWSVLESTGGLRHHRTRLDAEAAWVEGDPTRLLQIVENLVANAIKYTAAGGEITVTTAVEGEDAVLRVSDTGMGIEPDLLPRVFDLFVQGRQMPHRPTAGLGIGLTLVKRLVDMHGGRVVASSPGPGRGSTFEVRLPRVPAASPAPMSTPPGRRTGTGRVLIIEDDADAREMLRVVLELDGHEVHVANEGLTGLEMALSLAPDVAIVDIGLPGIDGYEVARRIRASDAGRAMKLVALSGYGQAEDRRRSREAGFDLHLVKPVEEAVLAEAIRPTT
jgi:signal transduction histidine kinase/CheY-like chemotaxis protein